MGQNQSQQGANPSGTIDSEELLKGNEVSKYIIGKNVTVGKKKKPASVNQMKTNYHKPTPMKEDDIFKLYTEMIENDFANNQHQYQNTIKNKQSVLAAVKEKFKTIETNQGPT